MRRLTRSDAALTDGRDAAAEERTLTLAEGTVAVLESSRRRKNGVLQTRSYSFPDGDTVCFGRLEADNADCGYTVVEEMTLAAESGVVTWYNRELQEWQAQPLGEFVCDSRMVYLETETEDVFLWTPIGYQVIENGSLTESSSAGWVTITKAETGWRLRVFSDYVRQNTIADYTIVVSSRNGRLLDFDYKMLSSIWKNYNNCGDGRWCYDGYYYPAAYNYIPTDCRYWCPAAYLVNSMVGIGPECRLADKLGIAMIDTCSLRQNDSGYFPTPSGSEWLRDDYGIGPGFYDTRFNSEMIRIVCRSCEQHGGFQDILQRYAEFFCKYAESRHFETAHGGWLVFDYVGTEPDPLPTHCSLNHQLAEIERLFEMDRWIDDPRLIPLAERMLLAIDDCGNGWLREDGNLHYAFYPDGSFGGQDYPCLTYNDMFDVQRLLVRLGRPEAPVLQMLMDSKRAWMDANGITEYKK